MVGCASAAMMLKRFKRFSSQIFKWQNYNTGKITWIPFLLKYIWPSTNSLSTLWGRFFLEIQSLQVLFYWMIIIKDYDCDLLDKEQIAFPNNLKPCGCEILFKRSNQLFLYPLFLICCYKKVQNSCLFFSISLRQLPLQFN